MVNVDFIFGDILSLPLRRHSIDAIIMSEVLEHLLFLPRELIGILKKGAVIVVLFPNINPYQPFYFILRTLPQNVKKNCWIVEYLVDYLNT